MRLRSALTLAVLGVLPLPAVAWGCRGHQVVAEIAWQQMTAHARAHAAELLAASPIDPALARYCQERGLPGFVDSSTWADDVRGQRPRTGPWHFINIPLGAPPGAVERFCPPERGCVTQAIRRQLAVLRSSQATPAEQAEALRFLIHLVGDLHQPLHAADDDDLGGNCVPVSFFEEAPRLRGSTPGEQARADYRPNLHEVWDTGLLERISAQESVAAFAQELERSFAERMVTWKQPPADLDAWAWESHQQAVKIAYGKLPVAVPVEPPRAVTHCGDDQVGARRLRLHESIGSEYLEQAAPVIEEQLAKAGTRLAVLLNQLWP